MGKFNGIKVFLGNSGKESKGCFEWFREKVSKKVQNCLYCLHDEHSRTLWTFF